jgi:hypothetical protein
LNISPPMTRLLRPFHHLELLRKLLACRGALSRVCGGVG